MVKELSTRQRISLSTTLLEAGTKASVDWQRRRADAMVVFMVLLVSYIKNVGIR